MQDRQPQNNVQDDLSQKYNWHLAQRMNDEESTEKNPFQPNSDITPKCSSLEIEDDKIQNQEMHKHQAQQSLKRIRQFRLQQAIYNNDNNLTPLVSPQVKNLQDYDITQQTISDARIPVVNLRGQDREQPFYHKLLSHNLPLTRNLISLNRVQLDRHDRQIVLERHKEAKSQFEQTTIMEIYENRVAAEGTKLWIGYLLLATVIISGAAFVPLGVNLDLENPMLKVSWRVTGMLPFIGAMGIF